LIPLSALQHYLFCPRQCALIHVEQVWAEDAATAEGRLLHAQADSGRRERREGVRILRGVALRSLSLGVSGIADVVELHGDPPRAFPVEYKHGKPKSHRADEVQVCAQAIALEEMLGQSIELGALFYGETRRRHDVVFDAELRALTHAVATAARADIAAGRTPPPTPTPACKRCSLASLCRPEKLAAPPRVATWLARQIAAATESGS
jgi:CRISPR-associated exonuclease Cas4